MLRLHRVFIAFALFLSAFAPTEPALAGTPAQCLEQFAPKPTELFDIRVAIDIKRLEAEPFRVPGLKAYETRQWALTGVANTVNLMPLVREVTDGKIAVNLTNSGQFSVVTSGMTHKQNQALVSNPSITRIQTFMSRVSPAFRNKFFEIIVKHGQVVSAETKFPWELPVQIANPMLTGFAQNSGDVIRAFQDRRRGDLVRRDLLNQHRSQETFQTCGFSSLAQVLNAKGIKVIEEQLVTAATRAGITNRDKIHGSDPGITLPEIERFAQMLGAKYGFTAEMKLITNEADVQEYVRNAELASNRANKVDVIMNYNSPSIGRPGSGHYSPVGGFNSNTKEVLTSEANLVSNPPFWAPGDRFAQAMSEPDTHTPRGYILVHWNR